MAKSDKGTKVIQKSAKTGEIVSTDYAKTHPATTYGLKVPVVPPKKK